MDKVSKKIRPKRKRKSYIGGLYSSFEPQSQVQPRRAYFQHDIPRTYCHLYCPVRTLLSSPKYCSLEVFTPRVGPIQHDARIIISALDENPPEEELGAPQC